MTLTRHDADGHLVSSEEVPWDGYDLRTRPWFVGANQRRDLHWTDVYPFFTGRVAGVTASVPAIGDSDAARLVIGADVTLDSISRFLRSLSIGKTGLAIVVDSQARLIAHPDAELVHTNADRSIRLARVQDLGNPVINRAFDRYRVEGHGRRDFELNGRRYISSASSLNHLLQRDWSILVVVPGEDFVGFVVENVGKTLGMGLSVIALAAVLAGLLIHQGLRADRDALRILDRRGQLDAQGEVLMRLTAVGAQALGSGNAQA